MTPKLRFSKTDGTEYPHWESRQFGSAMAVLPHNSLSRDKLTDGENAGVRDIHYGDIYTKFGSHLDVRTEHIPSLKDPKAIKNLQAAQLRTGDVVLADTAEDTAVGKTVELMGLQDGDSVISGLHTIPCRSKDAGVFASGFLGYYLNSPHFHDQLKPLMQGTKVTSITKDALLSRTRISFPKSIEEQQEIVAFLSEVDSIIAMTEVELEKLTLLKSELMKLLFSDQTTD